MHYSLDIPKDAKAIGYGWLVSQYGLKVLPHHVRSFVSSKAERQEFGDAQIVTVVYPARTTIPEDWVGHLEFALRKEGVHLQLIRQLFTQVDPSLLTERVKSRPTGKYLRKIWYLYEAISGQLLLIPDLTQGNYIDLLDPNHYYTSFSWPVKRQRINHNLLGDIGFCGLVRKTPKLQDYAGEALEDEARNLVQNYSPTMFERAMNYLYRKETKSSFEIEKETPDQQKTRNFMALLEHAARGDYFSRESLTRLQNQIVEERLVNLGFRDEIDEQIYVGESVILGKEIVHFAGPRPEDTGLLMREWADMARILSETNDLHPVIAAAIVAFGFVFIHPFSDGNGRIHRFLIHHLLAKHKFAPPGVIFPVSAVMLKRSRDYDAALESFSKPLMGLVEYDLDDRGRMTVTNETIDLYRSIDYTQIAETLFEFVAETIKIDMPRELTFLERHDRVRKEMKDVVDLKGRVADLFVRYVIDNGGSLSQKRRRSDDFNGLTNEEISELERVVRRIFEL